MDPPKNTSSAGISSWEIIPAYVPKARAAKNEKSNPIFNDHKMRRVAGETNENHAQGSGVHR